MKVLKTGGSCFKSTHSWLLWNLRYAPAQIRAGKEKSASPAGTCCSGEGRWSPLTFLARASASHQGCLAKLVGLAAWGGTAKRLFSPALCGCPGPNNLHRRSHFSPLLSWVLMREQLMGQRNGWGEDCVQDSVMLEQGFFEGIEMFVFP